MIDKDKQRIRAFFVLIFAVIIGILLWQLHLLNISSKEFAHKELTNLGFKDVLISEINSEKVFFTANTSNKCIVFGIGLVKPNPRWVTLNVRLFSIQTIYTGKSAPDQ